MVWATLTKDDVVDPFRVLEGVKIDCETYCELLNNTMVKQWFVRKLESFKKAIILM